MYLKPATFRKVANVLNEASKQTDAKDKSLKKPSTQPQNTKLRDSLPHP
jgi:hypothetical protein